MDAMLKNIGKVAGGAAAIAGVITLKNNTNLIGDDFMGQAIYCGGLTAGAILGLAGVASLIRGVF